MGTWICFTSKCRDRNQQLNLEKLKAKVEIKKDNNDVKIVAYQSGQNPDEWKNTVASGQVFANIGLAAQGVGSAIASASTGGLSQGVGSFSNRLLNGITGQTPQTSLLPDTNQNQQFNISQFMPLIIIGALLMFLKK